MNYDVFNGDADGICALQQLRQAEPRQAVLVSGVKRDIRLLDQLAADPLVAGAEITVLDVSMESNKDSLETLLQRGNNIFYVDHHFAGEIPAADNLRATIDPAADVCTGLLVDRLLGGRFRLWAVVAAFGDNLHAAARQAAAGLGLSGQELAMLQELGELMNYNGYGRQPADLHITPQELFRAVAPFASPFAFYRESGVPGLLRQGYAEDMARARAVRPLAENASGRIFTLPDASWSRRVAGVFSNEKAREMEDKAHALIVDNGDGTLLVSVRAPLTNKQGAASLCRQFPTGGGREAAAGINALPQQQLDAFVEAFRQTW
ncbi:MAG: DHH family phosphoesterase [Thermodesulfobacteriota bacterium]